MKSGLSLVMATRNESECIEEVLRELALALSKLNLKVELVIADYSEDDTLVKAIKTAESCSIAIIPLKVHRPGRGYALRLGIDKARFDLICLFDADGNHDPKYILKLLRAYKSGCIVSASRFPPLGWSEEHTFFHYYGNKIAVAAFNLLFGSKITDITNGLYIMNRKTWDSLEVNSNYWSFDVQILCRAFKRGVEVVEIPYFEPKRKGGKGRLNLFDAFWRIGGRVFLERMTS